MKKIFKKAAAVLLTTLIVFSCWSVALAAKTSNVVLDVVYDENNNRIGFNRITVDNEIVYSDIFGGDGSNVEDLNAAEFYKKALAAPFKHNSYKSTLNLWGKVAKEVFRTAGQGFGWNWEFGENFDDWYGQDLDNDSTSNTIENADMNLDIVLGTPWSYSSGDLTDHCVRSTGLQHYSSLDKVQNVMLNQIVDVCGEEDVAEEFKEVVLEFCIGDKEGFELFKNTDDQIVLANIASNQYDGTAKERYFSTFGIVFYDFKLTPIIQEDLEYISAADNYDTIKEAFENDTPGVSYIESSDGSTSVNYIQNPTSTPASVSTSSDKSKTTSISNSFTESEGHTYTESVSIGTEIAPVQSIFKFSIETGFSASQAISTAYSESTSISETISTSSSASVTLPPYTELGIKQSVSKTEQTVEYECPVYITYKTAVFGVNAQYYQDVGTGSWSTSGYDQGCIFVGFGSDSSIGGVNAVDSLNNRLEENSQAFEISYGNTYGMYERQGNNKAPIKINYLDWNNPVAFPILSNQAFLLETIVPMSSMGGKMTFNTDSINTEITQIYPIYDLERIRFEGAGTYNLAIGGKLDLNTVNVVGLNKFDYPYYGFQPTMGAWQLCDKYGNDIAAFEEGKGITIETTPTTQIIEANELGDYYLRFDIDEECYTKAVNRKKYITNDDLEMTAIMKLSVTDTGNNHTCRAGSWVTTVVPGCNSEGERCRYCLTCSKRMVVEVIPKTGHTPVEIIEPATCLTDGSKRSTCATCEANCGFELIPAKGHGEVFTVTSILPTCTVAGEKTIYCTDCNMIVGSEEIPATGHDDGVWKIDFEATAEYNGQMTRYCSTCNKALESKTFGQHKHLYSSWTNINDDYHVRYCNSCDAVETAAHLYGEYVSNNDATENADGTKSATCSVCSYTKTVTDEGTKLNGDAEADQMSFFEKIINFFRNLFNNLFGFLS